MRSEADIANHAGKRHIKLTMELYMAKVRNCYNEHSPVGVIMKRKSPLAIISRSLDLGKDLWSNI